jgi:predicted nucleotidyltransferase
MGKNASEILEGHEKLAIRLRLSAQRLAAVREKFSSDAVLKTETISVFCAGSLGRGEYAKYSDLDVFAVSTEERPSRMQQIKVLSRLIQLNDELDFPSFSQEMRYLRLYKYKDLVDHTGKPIDDSENSFTTRMLLILESKCLSGRDRYEEVLGGVVSNYFRDNLGKPDFRPLFLINDLLRYWRTLCLNYEECRNDRTKPWRKKNINLKFSRMTTIFSTICLLMVERTRCADEFLAISKLAPLQRLAKALDTIDDKSLLGEFSSFLDDYASFLVLKEFKNPERLLAKPGRKDDIRGAAKNASAFLYKCLMHEHNKDLSHYLVL